MVARLSVHPSWPRKPPPAHQICRPTTFTAAVPPAAAEPPAVPLSVSCAQVRNGSRVAMRAGGSSGQRGQKGRWRGIDADMDMSDDQQVGSWGANSRGLMRPSLHAPAQGTHRV